MSVFQVDDDGELVRDRRGFVRVSGLEEIAQGCTVYLRLLLGEIPTRLDKGIDWPNILAVATTETQLAQAVVERGVLTRPGVVAVDDVTVDIDAGTRTAAITYRATVSLQDLRRRVLVDGRVDVRV